MSKFCCLQSIMGTTQTCAWASHPGWQDGSRRRSHWAMAAPLIFVLIVYLIFGNNLKLIWSYNNLEGQLFATLKGQMILPFWSHWLKRMEIQRTDQELWLNRHFCLWWINLWEPDCISTLYNLVFPHLLLFIIQFSTEKVSKKKTNFAEANLAKKYFKEKLIQLYSKVNIP